PGRGADIVLRPRVGDGARQAGRGREWQFAARSERLLRRYRDHGAGPGPAAAAPRSAVGAVVNDAIAIIVDAVADFWRRHAAALVDHPIAVVVDAVAYLRRRHAAALVDFSIAVVVDAVARLGRRAHPPDARAPLEELAGSLAGLFSFDAGAD